jgi:hypothetical protein
MSEWDRLDEEIKTRKTSFSYYQGFFHDDMIFLNIFLL